MLGEPNTEQFEVVTCLNGEEVHRLKVHDPFIRTSTTIKGLGAAWNCLIRGLTVTTRVNGSHGAMREVMMLDPVKMAQHGNERNQVLLKPQEWSNREKSTNETNTRMQ